jgi:hypothetical protein
MNKTEEWDLLGLKNKDDFEIKRINLTLALNLGGIPNHKKKRIPLEEIPYIRIDGDFFFGTEDIYINNNQDIGIAIMDKTWFEDYVKNNYSRKQYPVEALHEKLASVGFSIDKSYTVTRDDFEHFYLFVYKPDAEKTL